MDGLVFWVLIWTGVLTLAVVALISRVSHWTHATQAKIEVTNTLLQALVNASPKASEALEEIEATNAVRRR